MMKVANYIRVRKPIFNKARDYHLGKGLVLYTDKVCEPMILFLVEEFEKDGSCLIGDIGSLYARKSFIDEKRINDLREQGCLSSYDQNLNV